MLDTGMGGGGAGGSVYVRVADAARCGMLQACGGKGGSVLDGTDEGPGGGGGGGQVLLQGADVSACPVAVLAGVAGPSSAGSYGPHRDADPPSVVAPGFIGKLELTVRLWQRSGQRRVLVPSPAQTVASQASTSRTPWAR